MSCILDFYYEGLVLPHLPKMVVNIVKLLRDSDFVVRDVSVNTVALLTSKLGREGDKKEKVFVLLVMPIFEALDKPNKHTLSGFALCLARIVNNTHHFSACYVLVY